jgi:DNA topoisomerase-6 subunit A
METNKLNLEQVVSRLKEHGTRLMRLVSAGEIPNVKHRTLSKSNVNFNLEKHTYDLGDSETEIRGDRKSSLKKLVALTFLTRVALERMEISISTTKRDYYYLQKSRHPLIAPSDQTESDNMIKVAEVYHLMSRESFGFVAQSKGYLYGDIVLREPKMSVNCLKTGGDGYSVPGNVEYIEIEKTNIKALLAIEKEGIYRNLMELGVPEKLGIGMAMLGGQPSRGMRRMLRKFSDHGIPIAILTDLNPYSLRIAANIIYGSIQSAHIGSLSSMSGKFIGLEVSDLERYFQRVRKVILEPLTHEDVKASNDNMNLPYMQGDQGYWLSENQWFIENLKKTELEAFNALTKHARELEGIYTSYIRDKLKEKIGVVV